MTIERPIAIASDHAGYDLKQYLIPYIHQHKYEVLDLGTNSQQSVDYPDWAQKLCQVVLEDIAPRGILICGSGVGMSICANRHINIRAALCTNVTTARLARAHNDSNVLVLGSRLIGFEIAKECVKTFLETPFDKGERHLERLRKIDKIIEGKRDASE